MFCPTCLWCGARLIQWIGRLQIAQSESLARRRAVLRDWVAWGHSEAAIRALMKSQSVPLGPAEGTASEVRKTEKRR